MNKILTSFASVIFLIFSTCNCWGALPDWPNIAPIKIEGVLDKKLVKFFVTPEVFDVVWPDLRDLRVLTDGDVELPYLVKVAEDKSQKKRLEVKLLNHSFIPNKQSSVEVDFGRKVLKNNIKVISSGANFRRKVNIEASDDAKNWETIVEGAYLFSVDDKTGERFKKDTVKLPDNDKRYLRISVFNGDEDPERVEIEDIRAWEILIEPPELQPVPIVDFDIKEHEKNNTTDISLDLGFRNLPLYNLSLHFKDENFFRRVSIYGRNTKVRILKRKVEDAPPLEKKVEEPWHFIKSGVVYKYSSGQEEEKSPPLQLNSSRHKYLKVAIHNKNNPPLNFQKADIKRLAYSVYFEPKAGKEFNLYFGNTNASVKSYDLVHYFGRLKNEGIIKAILGKVIKNPDHISYEKPVPLTEKYKWLIWIALIVVLAVLVLIIVRQAKSAKSNR